MAVVYELVVDFGANEGAAQRYREWLLNQPKSVTVGDKEIGLHDPLLERTRQHYFSVDIIPVRIGYSVGLDHGLGERIPLTKGELADLGLKLYEFVRGRPGYQLAMVGWDVDYWLFPEELKSEWRQEITEGSLKGLVISKQLLREFPGACNFMPFDDEHDWVPYVGDR